MRESRNAGLTPNALKKGGAVMCEEGVRKGGYIVKK